MSYINNSGFIVNAMDFIVHAMDFIVNAMDFIVLVCILFMLLTPPSISLQFDSVLNTQSTPDHRYYCHSYCCLLLYYAPHGAASGKGCTLVLDRSIANTETLSWGPFK